MVQHLLANFLDDPEHYAKAVEHWERLWGRIDSQLRASCGWRQPWFHADWKKGGAFMDGNPIFTAFTPGDQYAIRIIQYPPTSTNLEFDYWLDTFGGAATDPEAIRELVIACALSEEASTRAFELMENWVLCRGISISSSRSPVADYPVIGPLDARTPLELLMV